MRESDPKLLTIDSASAMRELGSALGAALLAVRDRPLVVGFEGELGAGKTTLIAGVLSAAGVRGPVRSPTYTLVEPYELADRTIYHLDLYRLADARELEPLALPELLVPGAILLIEWPSRGGDRVPALDLHVAIDYVGTGEEGRRVQLTPRSPVGIGLLTQFLR